MHLEDPAEFLRRVILSTTEDRWVADGNYSGVRDHLWERASHLVWLDCSRPVVMRRVIARSIRRAMSRDELWPGTGNREHWRNFLEKSHPICWAWDNFHRQQRDRETRLAEARYRDLRILRLKRPGDASKVISWLEGS